MTTSGRPNGGGEAPGEGAAASSHRKLGSAHRKLGSASETVVLATFVNRHAAEHMLASLGREFRRKARKGGVAAFLVTGNADGSFSLVQSRVLTASGVVSAGLHVTLAILVYGGMGLRSALRGGKTAVHATHVHEKHVGGDDQRLREMLAKPGPDASLLVVRCADPAEASAVLTQAAQRGGHDSWHGSRAEFRAGVEAAEGTYDWVRAAFDEPPKASS